VKSGQTITERVSELTGIPEDTVRGHIDGRYKQEHDEVGRCAQPESDSKSSRSRSRRGSKESFDSSQVPKALVETRIFFPFFL
jgi:hypothetical protein